MEAFCVNHKFGHAKSYSTCVRHMSGTNLGQYVLKDLEPDLVCPYFIHCTRKILGNANVSMDTHLSASLQQFSSCIIVNFVTKGMK